MNVLFQKLLRQVKDFTSQNNHRRRPVPSFFVLRARQFDHTLRRRMRDVNLSQNRIPVIRQHDACVRAKRAREVSHPFKTSNHHPTPIAIALGRSTTSEH